LEWRAIENLISIGLNSNINKLPQSFPNIRMVNLREIKIVLRKGNYEENIQGEIFNFCRLKSETF